MGELLFLVGAIIGGLISYFFLQYKYQNFKGNEHGLQERLERAETQNRELSSQLSQCEKRVGKVGSLEEQVQRQTAELQAAAGKLADAEQQVAMLQDQLTSAESEEVPSAEETSPQEVVEEPLPEGEEVSPNVSEDAPSEEETAASAVLEEVEETSPVEEPVRLKEPLEEERSIKKDDLRKIEGIGPKAASILNDAGIMTFEQLSQAEASQLRAILEKAGPSFKGMVPESWPEQAGLAAKEDWDGLKVLQDQLDGGRYKTS